MRNRWLGLLVGAVALLASGFFWSRLPDSIPSHWDIRGEADGHSSRATAALVIPALIFGATFVVQLIPLIDPRRRNYEKFAATYWLVVNALFVFAAVMHIAVLAGGAGYPVDMGRVIAGSVAVLLIGLGNRFGQVRPNWFFGIRTPWTLDNPDVWRRTHRVAGWMFVAAGLIVAVSVFIPALNPLGIALVASLTAAITAAVLSLVFWFQEKRS